MVRHTAALTVLAVAATGIVVYGTDSSALMQRHIGEAKDSKPFDVRGRGCQTELGGRVVELQPGQGVETGEGWRNCQTYDGHSLIVYSGKPPKSAVMENGR